MSLHFALDYFDIRKFFEDNFALTVRLLMPPMPAHSTKSGSTMRRTTAASYYSMSAPESDAQPYLTDKSFSENTRTSAKLAIRFTRSTGNHAHAGKKDASKHYARSEASNKRHVN